MRLAILDGLFLVVLLIGILTKIYGVPESVDTEGLQNAVLAALVLWATLDLFPRAANKLRNTPLSITIPLATAFGLWFATVYIMELENELLLELLLIAYLILTIPVQRWIAPRIAIKLANRKERKTDDSRARE